jgi:hypothetical protein
MAGPRPRPPAKPTDLPLAHVLVLCALLAPAAAFAVAGAFDTEDPGEDLLPQWVLARLAVTGHGTGSYDYATQAELVRALPIAEHRLQVLDSPQIKDIGLCPYPPTLAVPYAPLGALPFEAAVRVVYFVTLALAVVAAWAIGRSAGGRVHGLTALVAIAYYPGFHYTLQLGQNSVLTLALWALGWQALIRRRDVAAGVWWGLLAYKAHWLLAVGWLPLVLGRPRVLAGMAASAGLLAVAATVWLGPAAWGRWLEQVAAVDRVYATDADFRAHLLGQGCDLRSVLNRALGPDVGRWAGWAALALVAAATAVWYRRRNDGPEGPSAAGLLFASGLTVPHLYYYDETVMLLPLLVLWSWRAALTWRQLGALAVLSALFYVALLHMRAVGFTGLPVATLAVVGLWGLSLTVPPASALVAARAPAKPQPAPARKTRK